MSANDVRVLGECGPEEIAAYLSDIGDEEAAERFRRAGVQGQGFGRYLGMDQYAYTGVLVGFVPPGSGETSAIANAAEIEADVGLKGARLKLTLDGFFVQSYPGNGKHRILCDFAGQNQLAGDTEELRFALTVEANDGQSAGIQGKPIFMGVTVGEDGLQLRGQTINISSAEDDVILDALNSDAFKAGLALVTTAQPALRPFVGLASSVVKAAANRSKNKPVFKFEVGLDFNQNNLSARLRRGTYVVVQSAEESWDWGRFKFARNTRTVLRKTDGAGLPLNYLVLGVDDFAGVPATPKSTRSTKAKSSDNQGAALAPARSPAASG